jgi:hypothetical protein
MSLRAQIEGATDHLSLHFDHIHIDKNASEHGEDAVKITASIPGMPARFLEATYLKRNKLSDTEIAQLFSKKLDSVLRGTYSEEG